MGGPWIEFLILDPFGIFCNIPDIPDILEYSRPEYATVPVPHPPPHATCAASSQRRLCALSETEGCLPLPFHPPASTLGPAHHATCSPPCGMSHETCSRCHLPDACRFLPKLVRDLRPFQTELGPPARQLTPSEWMLDPGLDFCEAHPVPRLHGGNQFMEGGRPIVTLRKVMERGE